MFFEGTLLEPRESLQRRLARPPTSRCVNWSDRRDGEEGVTQAAVKHLPSVTHKPSQRYKTKTHWLIRDTRTRRRHHMGGEARPQRHLLLLCLHAPSVGSSMRGISPPNEPFSGIWATLGQPVSAALQLPCGRQEWPEHKQTQTQSTDKVVRADRETQ